MKWSNAFHNLVNITITMLAALAAFDWSMLIEPQLAVKVIGALSLAKIVLNVLRDGFTGLVAEQPPVVAKAPAPESDDDGGEEFLA